MKYFFYFTTGLIIGVLSMFIIYSNIQKEDDGKDVPLFEYLGKVQGDSKLEEVINDSIYREPYMPASCNNPYVPDCINQTGVIPTAEMAAKMAYLIISNIYGTDCAAKEMPYKITLINDREWSVVGSLPEKYMNGGTFSIVLDKKTNEVLCLMHGK